MKDSCIFVIKLLAWGDDSGEDFRPEGQGGDGRQEPAVTWINGSVSDNVQMKDKPVVQVTPVPTQLSLADVHPVCTVEDELGVAAELLWRGTETETGWFI